MRYEESVRGSDAFVIQSHATPINEAIMEQLIMIDALKRASAKRITVVLPFYGYARQDKKHRGREPISARLMADLFKTAGRQPADGGRPAHRADPGLLRRPGRPPDGAADPRRVRRREVRQREAGRGLARRRPDQGGRAVVERLGGAPLAFIHKTRDINRPNETVANRVVGEVKGRVCVLVDDMIDTGGTITKAADALMADGAAGVVIAATHAILSGPAVERLKECTADEVIVTNTLPIAESQAVRQAHRAVDRPADQPGDPGGLRGRLGDEPVRRPRLTTATRRPCEHHRSGGSGWSRPTWWCSLRTPRPSRRSRR